MGRITCIIACVWGVFIVSLFFVAADTELNFDERRKNEGPTYKNIVEEREKMS